MGSVIKLCGLWLYVMSFCDIKVSLEILNLIDILTTIMKSKHIMYKQDWTYHLCVCVPGVPYWVKPCHGMCWRSHGK